MPASPPLMPTMILSSTTSGAAVIAWPVGLSPTCTDPALDAGLRVERDQIAVERADVDRVVEDGDAAVDAREAEVQHARRDRPRPFPERLAALQIERGDRRRARRDVHHAVGDERRALRPSRRPAADTPTAGFSRATLSGVICVSGEKRCELYDARVHQPLAVLREQRATARRATSDASAQRQPTRRAAAFAVRSVVRSFRTSQRREIRDQIVELRGREPRAYDGISVASSSRSSSRELGLLQRVHRAAARRGCGSRTRLR